MNTLTSVKFSEIIEQTDIPLSTVRLISKLSLQYRPVTTPERDSIILSTLKKIERASRSGKHRKNEWEQGWNQNLEEFSKTNNVASLKPRYYRSNHFLRLGDGWIYTPNDDFEYCFFQIVRDYVAHKYLCDKASVWEFGCGPAHNLVYLSKLMPNAVLYGLDWAEASIEIMKQLPSQIHGRLFDMFNPNLDDDIGDNSAFVTIGGMEQLGAKFGQFADFMIRTAPSLCVHIEPIVELYDSNCLFDHIASEFHGAKNYLGQYLSYLRRLQDEVEIIDVIKVPCGLDHNGWNIVCWRAHGI